MMLRIFALIILVLFFSAQALHAEELTLNAFVNQVLTNHPLLNATEQEIEASRAEYLSTQGAFDPVLKGEYSGYAEGDYPGKYGNLFVEQPFEFAGARAFAGYRRGQGKFPVYEDYYNTNTGGEARVGIELPLLRDGPIDRRRAAIARAAMQVDAGLLGLTQRKLELYRISSFAYWDWVGAFEKRQAFKALLSTAEERDRQFGKRVQAGDLAQVDKLDNERQVLQRKTQLINADRNLQKSIFDLSLFWWDQSGQPAPIDGKVPSKRTKLPSREALNIEAAKEVALRRRPDIARIQNLIDQQKIEHGLAENQILPRFDVQAMASDDLGSGSSTRDETELKAAVKLEIPLATRTQRGRIQAISAKLRELEQQRILAERKVVVEILDAYNALTQAISRASTAEEEVRVTAELEKAERRKLDLGESNLIFVNLREQATVDAQVRQIDAVVESWKSWATLQAAIGEQTL